MQDGGFVFFCPLNEVDFVGRQEFEIPGAVGNDEDLCPVMVPDEFIQGRFDFVKVHIVSCQARPADNEFFSWRIFNIRPQRKPPRINSGWNYVDVTAVFAEEIRKISIAGGYGIHSFCDCGCSEFSEGK